MSNQATKSAPLIRAMSIACIFATIALPLRAADPSPRAIAAGLSERIDAEARRVLKNVTKSSYSHKVEVDEKAGVYVLDCSGLVDLLLKNVAPAQLKEIEARRSHHRELAEDYVQTFEDAPAFPPSSHGAGAWQHITRISSARPGDILAWKNPLHQTGDHTNTGHVMIIDALPVEEPASLSKDGHRLWRIVVIDSTASPHADDTRAKDQSGVGRGTLWLAADDEGLPIAYHWRNPKAAAHEAPIVIGRAIDCQE